MRKARRCTCAMITALAVASCGSDDDKDDTGDDTSSNIDFVGLVLVNELKSTDDEFFLSLGGFFLNASAVALNDPTETEFELDICEVDGASDLPFNVATDSVSAGDTVIVSNAAGTLATMVNSAEEGQGFSYTVPQDALQVVSTGPAEVGVGVPAGDSSSLVIDVAGDTFPGFSNIAVERAVSIELLSATDDDLGFPTVFSWGAGEPVQTDTLANYIEINLFGEDDVTVTCRVVDDGSFEMPQAFIATLSDFSYQYGDIVRERLEVFPQANAAMGVLSSSNAIEF